MVILHGLVFHTYVWAGFCLGRIRIKYTFIIHAFIKLCLEALIFVYFIGATCIVDLGLRVITIKKYMENTMSVFPACYTTIK